MWKIRENCRLGFSFAEGNRALDEAGLGAGMVKHTVVRRAVILRKV